MKSRYLASALYCAQTSIFIAPIEKYSNGTTFLFIFTFLLLIFLLGFKCLHCGASPAETSTVGRHLPFWGSDFSKCGVCGQSEIWSFQFLDIFRKKIVDETKIPSAMKNCATNIPKHFSSFCHYIILFIFYVLFSAVAKMALQ